MTEFIKDPKNGLWIGILIIFVTFCIPRVTTAIPVPIVTLFERNWFRAFVVFTAVYLAQRDIKISLLIAIIFLLVNYSIQNRNMYKSFQEQYGDVKENFSTTIRNVPVITNTPNFVIPIEVTFADELKSCSHAGNESCLKAQGMEVATNSVCNRISHDKNYWVFGRPKNPDPSALSLPLSTNIGSDGKKTDSKTTFLTCDRTASSNIGGCLAIVNESQVKGGVSDLSNSQLSTDSTNMFVRSQAGPGVNSSPVCRVSYSSGEVSNFKGALPSTDDGTDNIHACKHSGQCCGYKGDHVASGNALCLAVKGDTNKGRCFDVDIIDGTQQGGETTLGSLENVLDCEQYECGKNNAYLSNINSLYKAPTSDKDLPSVHLSPNFAQHDPLDEDGKSMCLDATKDLPKIGAKCALNWGQQFLTDQYEGPYTGGRIDYPDFATSLGGPSLNMGLGCWNITESDMHSMSDKERAWSLQSANQQQISFDLNQNNANSSAYRSPHEDVKVEHFTVSSGIKKEYGGNAPPVNECNVYSNQDTDFTGTAFYPLNPVD